MLISHSKFELHLWDWNPLTLVVELEHKQLCCMSSCNFAVSIEDIIFKI